MTTAASVSVQYAVRCGNLTVYGPTPSREQVEARLARWQREGVASEHHRVETRTITTSAWALPNGENRSSDAGSATVALFLAGCIAGALAFLALLALGQQAVCWANGELGPRYCQEQGR